MAPTPKPTCGICCEPLNKSTRKPVTCGCEYTACAACTRRYLLESPNEPDCMSCHRRWTIPALCEKLPRTFVNGPLREHTMEMVLDRERSRLPATQPYAARVKMALRQNVHRLHYARLSLLLGDRAALSVRGGIQQLLYPEERRLLYAEMFFTANLTEQAVQDLLAQGANADAASPSAPARNAYRYVRACPADGCRGFLSEDWRCEMCDTQVCKKCHEVKSGAEGRASHACDPNAVATAALLAKDSRPCPKCAAMIYRIEGCAHMFCTACNTPFHWNTGAIMTSNSNPLYYDWQRRRAALRAPETPAPAEAAPAEVPAPVCDTPEATYEWLQRTAPIYTEKVREIAGVRRNNPIATLPMCMAHNRYAIGMLRERSLRWNGTGPAVAEDPHRPVRLSYMLGLCDEAAFKSDIRARERKLHAMRDFSEVYEMFNAAMGDLALRAFRARGPEAIGELARELSELRDYANDALGQLVRAHGMKTTMINEVYSIPI